MSNIKLAFMLGAAWGMGKALGMDHCLAQDSDKWITVKPHGEKEGTGRPVLIDGETGVIKGGMGNKFVGQNIRQDWKAKKAPVDTKDSPQGEAKVSRPWKNDSNEYRQQWNEVLSKLGVKSTPRDLAEQFVDSAEQKHKRKLKQDREEAENYLSRGCEKSDVDKYFNLKLQHRALEDAANAMLNYSGRLVSLAFSLNDSDKRKALKKYHVELAEARKDVLKHQDAVESEIGSLGEKLHKISEQNRTEAQKQQDEERNRRARGQLIDAIRGKKSSVSNAKQANTTSAESIETLDRFHPVNMKTDDAKAASIAKQKGYNEDFVNNPEKVYLDLYNKAIAKRIKKDSAASYADACVNLARAEIANAVNDGNFTSSRLSAYRMAKSAWESKYPALARISYGSNETGTAVKRKATYSWKRDNPKIRDFIKEQTNLDIEPFIDQETQSNRYKGVLVDWAKMSRVQQQAINSLVGSGKLRMVDNGGLGQILQKV